MALALIYSVFASVLHGGAVPLFWVIGAVLIIAGAITLLRGGVLVGILLVILGIILGGLNIF